MNDGGIPPLADAGILPPPKLDPIPDRSYPYCVGPDHGDGPGYYGQCCGEVRCVETVAGACPEASSSDALAAIKPPGSGTCGCETDEGPFARPDQPDLEEGDCCYVIYGIFCDGRPLKRNGVVVAAEVVARRDWMGGSELPAWS